VRTHFCHVLGLKPIKAHTRTEAFADVLRNHVLLYRWRARSAL